MRKPPQAALWCLFGVLGACRDADGRAVTQQVLPPLRDAVVAGRLTDPELVEASGLTESPIEPGVFWAQNDSGNDERLFAFDSTGRALGSVFVSGAKNRDWEALTHGPCPQGTCLYIGDVGDNAAVRNDVRLWRVPTPRAADRVVGGVTRLVFRYPDGAHDVESIWVAPDTAVYLLTKRPESDGAGAPRSVRIYRLPPTAWSATEPVVATLFDSLPIVPQRGDGLGWVTDAALSAADSTGARRLAVRTYRDVAVFRIEPGSYRPSTLVGHCSLAGIKEGRSGEGITWLADGRLMFDAEGERARVHTGRCP